MYIYQLLMGDASHSAFLEYSATSESGEGHPKSITPYILYVLYLIASFLVTLIMLNIVIAIMGNAQAMRSELGRKVIYRNQLKTVIQRIHKFKHTVSLEDWMDRA